MHILLTRNKNTQIGQVVYQWVLSLSNPLPMCSINENNNYTFMRMWCEMTDVYMLAFESIFRFHRLVFLCFLSSAINLPVLTKEHKVIINVKMRGITPLNKRADSLRSVTDKLFLSNWNVLSASEVHQLKERATSMLSGKFSRKKKVI